MSPQCHTLAQQVAVDALLRELPDAVFSGLDPRHGALFAFPGFIVAVGSHGSYRFSLGQLLGFHAITLEQLRRFSLIGKLGDE